MKPKFFKRLYESFKKNARLELEIFREDLSDKLYPLYDPNRKYPFQGLKENARQFFGVMREIGRDITSDFSTGPLIGFLNGIAFGVWAPWVSTHALPTTLRYFRERHDNVTNLERDVDKTFGQIIKEGFNPDNKDLLPLFFGEALRPEFEYKDLGYKALFACSSSIGLFGALLGHGFLSIPQNYENLTKVLDSGIFAIPIATNLISLGYESLRSTKRME